jgi:hypothetical protein
LFHLPEGGSRDDPKIGALHVEGTHRAEFLLLKNSQHLRLQVERQLAHLIEKRRSPIGHLEQPNFLHDGAGERPLCMAEQFVRE